MKAGVQIEIDDEEFDWRFARSGGPGGQNVNKVNSKAILKWAIHDSHALTHHQKRRFAEAFGNRINLDGTLTIQSDAYRDQARNVADCLTRLATMLAAIEFAPKKRRKTKPTKASIEKRLSTKQRRKDTKSNRGRPRAEES